MPGARPVPFSDVYSKPKSRLFFGREFTAKDKMYVGWMAFIHIGALAAPFFFRQGPGRAAWGWRDVWAQRWQQLGGLCRAGPFSRAEASGSRGSAVAAAEAAPASSRWEL